MLPRAMASIYSLFLIAVAAGVAVALQGQIMGAVNRSVGTATTMLVTYGGGAIIGTLIWAFRRSPAVAGSSVPWYGWFAGALGLVIVGGMVMRLPVWDSRARSSLLSPRNLAPHW
jgi:bacterial/archaeal transporter family-2 protein